jgi:hypothetical protein
MTIATFSPTFSQHDKAVKNYWKAGLYLANSVFAFLLIRYGNLFSDGFTISASIIVIGVFLFAGVTRIRRLSDGSRLKAYIKDHEAWALILLAIFLIAGTMSYVAYRSRLDARTGPAKNSALSESAGGRASEQLGDELPTAAMMPESPSNLDSTTSNPSGQTHELAPANKRDNRQIHRKAIRHHHRG